MRAYACVPCAMRLRSDVDAFILSACGRDILPRLVKMTGETGMKPYVVLEDEGICLRALRNAPQIGRRCLHSFRLWSRYPSTLGQDDGRNWDETIRRPRG